MKKVIIEFKDGTLKIFDNADVGFIGDFVLINAWKSEADRRINSYYFPKTEIRGIEEE